MEERQNPPLGTSSGSLDGGDEKNSRDVNAVDLHRQEILPVAKGTLNGRKRLDLMLFRTWEL